MNNSMFPTKGNLILAKRSLSLSKMGYELLDKKRNILIREMMMLIDKANTMQAQIDTTFSSAYVALQRANFTLGVIDNIASSVAIDDKLEFYQRSVMGVELPMLSLNPRDDKSVPYGMIQANSALDEAFISFTNVKMLCVQLAEIENSVYRLANGVKTTQKRANALKNIVIPRYEGIVKYISDALEEKEREEFTRQKVIKKRK